MHQPYLIIVTTLTHHKQPNGAEKATNVLGNITAKEQKLLEACTTGLKDNITKGVTFAHNPPQK